MAPDALDRATWVVGVDGSACARHAVDWAVRHAPGRADRVHLVETWQIPASGAYVAPAVMPGRLAADLEAGATQRVDELAEELRDRTSVSVTTQVCCGSAAHCLLDIGDQAGAIVVGSRGRGGFTRLLLGSTSTQVVTHSTVPTVVVPRSAEIDHVDRILVGVDGSDNASAALDWAVEHAPVDSQVECVMAWDVSPLTIPLGDAALREAAAASATRLDDLVAERSSGRDDVTVVSRFVEGPARSEIARLADESDLLVVGARGHGAVGAALLGSVSTWLLHHVQTTPIAVVPSGE